MMLMPMIPLDEKNRRQNDADKIKVGAFEPRVLKIHDSWFSVSNSWKLDRKLIWIFKVIPNYKESTKLVQKTSPRSRRYRSSWGIKVLRGRQREWLRLCRPHVRSAVSACNGDGWPGQMCPVWSWNVHVSSGRTRSSPVLCPARDPSHVSRPVQWIRVSTRV